MLTKENDISTEVVCFFSSLLSWDPLLSKKDQGDIISCIPQIIQPHHNKMLREIPYVQEVREALFSLPAEESPGLDGFPTFFFQFYW